ncbi:ubiquitin-related domain-containing protein [Naematelia encephala]|uniref:Ubiquitin-related domain-containing protein n=1 Tax=Naematelia encephala TaxID=71784 RepID=A0A1Y2AUS0_9TREE|nr:ubiquitin-related domain-containing protein [Naematelia encephala]
MSSDRAQLVAMGFEPARIDWALKATSNAGLQPAMDHLLANSDNPIPAADQQAASSSSANEDFDEEDTDALAAHIKSKGGSIKDDDLVAKSIKCSECGKVFRSNATASFHAEKSGHQEFEESTEEIKPLTEEEKKAKLAELRQKLAEKRANQAKEETVANKANEALRRKAGQDIGKAKEDLELKEVQKEAERKKREKLEDAKAKAAIKAQIELDKKERAERVAREKAARDGQAAPPAAASTPLAKPSAAVKSSENPETRLQVRLSTGGPPLTKTFPSDGTLMDVAEWIASESLAYNVDTVTFASTFPRKTFSRDEMTKTLKANGLTPSAVLLAS